MYLASCFLLIFALFSTHAFATESTCYGTVSRGFLEGGSQLPAKGTNFTAYSSTGVALGRTYVHDKVEEVMLDAYKALELSAPDKVFVYGETGWEHGGRIRPHRTHQNGTSVDFMVPVLNEKQKSVPLPTSLFNKFGYGIDFDRQGKYKNLAIDFEVMAEHLYQLSVAAKKRNIGISLVIFDPPLMPMLLKTRRGSYIQANLPFMKGNAWIRHDEHFHIDFSVPCKSLPN